MRNTDILYMYRDASNYKNTGHVIFRGEISSDLETRLRAALEDGDNFIADQVGVPEIFFEFGEDSAEDHSWHEFVEATVTSEDATDTRTVEEFVVAIEAASRAGWREFEQVCGERIETTI